MQQPEGPQEHWPRAGTGPSVCKQQAGGAQDSLERGAGPEAAWHVSLWARPSPGCQRGQAPLPANWCQTPGAGRPVGRAAGNLRVLGPGACETRSWPLRGVTRPVPTGPRTRVVLQVNGPALSELPRPGEL